jgi:monoamine oxidase
MEDQGGNWTRRKFLHMVGMAGGSAAVYDTMVALGLLRTPEAYAGPPQLPAGVGTGKSVVILGAGVGGLAAAYQLRKANYDVRVLEAQDRTGGRSYTVRRGNVIHQEGFKDQTCRFDEGLYFNAGPGRIPYHHQAMLSYCRDLKVDLEVYIMETRANLFQTPQAFKGKPVRNRQLANDTRGYIAELLAKAVHQNALDDGLSGDDKEKLLSLLTEFGKLKPGYQYQGSARSGFWIEPGVKEPGTLVPPLPLQSLLDSEFWKHRFYQPEDYEWQTTLFQPVGGMDHFAHALARQVEDRITLNAEVIQIFNSRDGKEDVRVVYRDRSTGRQHEVKANYCISNIPMWLVYPMIQNDTFRQDYKDALAVGAKLAANTCKVGWQANERFWESRDCHVYDPNGKDFERAQICATYGGISWINHDITQMWYPSSGFFQQKGILTGAYNYGKIAEEFGKKDLDERRRIAREGAERLYRDFTKYVDVNLGLSIAWQLVPFQRGGWASWSWDPSTPQPWAYNRLLEPDKRFQICGDQVSYLPGWQEGAVLSAHHVVEQVAGIKRKVPAVALETAAPQLRRSAAEITGEQE